MTTTMIARRVMTARGNSICHRCHSIIWRGHRIGLVDGIGWIHIECVLGRTLPAA